MARLCPLYNESQGSILVVALFHAAIDVAFTSAVPSPLVVTIVGALVTFWGIMVLIVAGPGCLSRRGKVVRVHGRDTSPRLSVQHTLARRST